MINKGVGKLENLHNWKYNNSFIKLYGYYDGEAGQENKFELPPPVENELYFGDLLIMKKTQEIQDFTTDDFLEFYNEMMGGFEDIEDTEDESDEEEIENHYSSEDSEWKPGDSEEEYDKEEEYDEDEEYNDEPEYYTETDTDTDTDREYEKEL